MRTVLTILLLLTFVHAFARTIEVGKNKLIRTVQAGIEAAKDGDTVLVEHGLYKESSITVTKSICLLGVDWPVLDGDAKYEIITLTGHSIIIKGFHFKNAGYSSTRDFAAIKIIDASHVLIENNRINRSYFAIHVANTTFSILRNNIIKGDNLTEQSSGNGIHLWKSDNMLIENNHIEGHRDGIYFEFVTNSIIQNNVSANNIRYGLHFMFSNNDAYLENTFHSNGAGVAVMFSHHVLMVKNQFDRNWGPSAYGILLKEISDSRIYQNSFIRNTVGILMEGTNRIEVELNKFDGNGWAIKVQASCNDNTFGFNNFLSNTFDIATNGSLTLNLFHRNYWDKYEGYDMNGDKVGDVPYHPVSMYAMVIEQNPNSVMLLRSFMVMLLDKAEKTIPSLTPEALRDDQPWMKPLAL